jgi:hypothetical protein
MSSPHQYKYKFIDIKDIVAYARSFDHHRPEYIIGCIGTCGLWQGVTYYSALIHGVPINCIKVCRADNIIERTKHAFTILILDKIYLVDLSFEQFLCEWERDKDSQLVRQLNTYDAIVELRQKGYTELTESVLITFYRLTTRYCITGNLVGYTHDNPDIDERGIELKNPPSENFNLLQLTIDYNWSNMPDYDPDEAYENGWINESQKEKIIQLFESHNKE